MRCCDSVPLCGYCLGKRAAKGFTLIELLVVIALVSVLLGLAVPSFSGSSLNSKLTSYSNDLVVSINLARNEALKRNAAITLCASADGTSCAASGGWEQGWIVACPTSDTVFCDPSGPNLLVLHRQHATSSAYRIRETSSMRAIVFFPTATGATQASFTVCRAAPLDERQRQITVSGTGRANVAKTNSATCA